jgi:RES domain-containing protein
MLIYRISLTKYAHRLAASGNAARWNPNDVKMIYAASSRSLACLENVVHRSQAGLSALFSVMIINCPKAVKIKKINRGDLPYDWHDYGQMAKTQAIGEKWIKDNETAILQVPSSIIDEEVNYLLNPEHEDFKLIRLVSTTPFVFDSRIKS